MPYSDRVAAAMDLMCTLHRDQQRKGSEVPYITHPMAVAALTGEYGGDEEQFIAALLHDAVEDQGGQETLALIRERFGDTVAGYVWACSDSDGHPKPPWRERKEKHVGAAAAAPAQVKLILAADKLHNAQCILRDLRTQGKGLWGRFKGEREGTLWYYGAMLRALASDWEHPILLELHRAVDALHHAARETGSG